MSEDKKKKIDRCRFSYLDWKNSTNENVKHKCARQEEEKKEWEPTDEARCEKCEHFKSRFIEFPITVNEIEDRPIDFRGLGHQQGCLVKIRPCGKEYGDKTYLGFYLGDLPLQNTISFNEEKGILKVGTFNNPAIFVPELRKIIWGCESWWGEIESVEQLREITDDDISNVWYVKMMKQLHEKDQQQESPAEETKEE